MAPQVSSCAYGISGLPVTVASSGGRLQAFLRQAVTMTEAIPLECMPVWATKSTGEGAGKKKGAKGGKDKAGGKEGKDGKKKKGGKKKVSSICGFNPEGCAHCIRYQ